jgi:hypothetical protein
MRVPGFILVVPITNTRVYGNMRKHFKRNVGANVPDTGYGVEQKV